MSPRPCMSIVVPVFNVAPYLAGCLDSLLAQKFRDWEAICVDDGSTDGSGAILDRYAAMDARFRVIHQNNFGVGTARNLVLDAARGKWLLFVDADDLCSPDMLSRVADLERGHPDAGILAFRQVKFEEGGEPAWSCGSQESEIDLRRSIPSCTADIGICTVALRRDMFGDLRFRPVPLGEDLLYLVECFARADAAVMSDAVLYGYRQREGSAVHVDMDRERVLKYIEYHELMFGVLAGCGKEIGLAYTRHRGNGWIEKCPWLIENLVRSERGETWKKWFESMAQAKKMKCFSPWQHFVASVMSIFRSPLLADLLCVLPHRLKRLGIHR